MSVWNRQLSVGNRILDSEHKNLHGIIGEIAGSIAARNVAALSGAFERLENCLCAYFAVEERIAQAVNFDFSKHGLAHQRLLDEVRRIGADLAAGNCGQPADGDHASCLMGCLIRHIKEDSLPLRIVLDTHLYDFQP